VSQKISLQSLKAVKILNLILSKTPNFVKRQPVKHNNTQALLNEVTFLGNPNLICIFSGLNPAVVGVQP
jgi:hypothetical protein